MKLNEALVSWKISVPQGSGRAVETCRAAPRVIGFPGGPAAATAEKGQTVYGRDDLQKVRLERGGTTYVLLPETKP